MRDRLLPAADVSGDSVVVRPAAADAERAAALRLLLKDTSDPAALDADVREVAVLAAAGELNLDGLLVAVPDGTGECTVLGATLATLGPGGTCDLFPPRLTRPDPAAAAALLDAAAQFAAAAGCDRVQAFADPVRTDDAAALAAANFDRACELLTLRRDCGTPVRESAGVMIAAVSLSWETNPRFRETNRESYDGSRDAPVARGADADADFAAHAESPGFRPDLCRLAVADGADAGLVLVAASGDGAAAVWDVCYLGVVPAFRGRGVGRALLAGRLAAARDAGAAAVTCAVDAANEPARRLYAAAGFAETGRRALFLKSLSEPVRDRAGGTGGGT